MEKLCRIKRTILADLFAAVLLSLLLAGTSVVAEEKRAEGQSAEPVSEDADIVMADDSSPNLSNTVNDETSIDAPAMSEDGSSKQAPPPPPIVMQVTGYALYTPSEGKKGKADPERLKAIRASRLDAYRNLAERVYGISLSGRSSVKDFVLQNDEFSVHLDTMIRGARVVSIAENQQTGIETVLELSLPASFFECLNKANSFKNTADCTRPLTASAMSSHDSSSKALRRPMNRQYYLR